MRTTVVRLALTFVAGMVLVACGEGQKEHEAESVSIKQRPVIASASSPVPTAPIKVGTSDDKRGTPDGKIGVEASAERASAPSVQQNRSATPVATPSDTRAVYSGGNPMPTAGVLESNSLPTDGSSISPEKPLGDSLAEVGRIVTTRRVDGLQRPIGRMTAFRPQERVYIAVEFINVEPGTRLGFAWAADAGCSGSYTSSPQPSIRRGFFGFFIDQTKCIGRYEVRILVDGVSRGRAEFSITPGGPIG